MRIGFSLPQFGPQAGQVADVGRFAHEAEELGADSLWVGDRLLVPVDPSVGYGGGPGIPAVYRAAGDPFALLAAAAARTGRVLLGTDVLQATLYPPAALARSLTTLDAISGGRLLPGFGIGWSPEEYQASGVPMKRRGALLDECLDVLDAWWGEGPVAHRGAHWSIPASHVDLRPVQRPRPPVHLAGFAPVALRRVARRGDGWLPVARPGAGPFDPETITGPMAEIRRLAAEEGRDPAAIGAVLRLNPVPGTTVDAVVETIGRAGAEAGVEHCFVELMDLAGDVDGALDVARTVLAEAR